MEEWIEGMMVFARCSAQDYVGSVALGSLAASSYTAGANGQLLAQLNPRPSLPQLIKQRHVYDLVYVPSLQGLGLFTLLMCKLLGKSYVLRVNEAEDLCDVENGLGQQFRPRRQELHSKLHKGFLRFVDAFVTPSFSVTAELIALGIDPQTIHVIPAGVDVKKFCKATAEEQLAMRKDLHLSTSPKLILYADQFAGFYENLFTMLRVWGEIQRKHDDAFLILVDNSPQHSAENQIEVLNFIHTHGVGGCVKYVGAEAAADYLRIADMFVLLGSGVIADTILLEAMACELPIIAVSNQDTDRLIQQGQNGLLIEKENFQQLFDAMETLLLHPGGARRLGEYARKTIEHNYAAESVAEAYAKLFCSISQS